MDYQACLATFSRKFMQIWATWARPTGQDGRPYGVAPTAIFDPVSVIARRAAGPTWQSVILSKENGFPRPLRGLGMTGQAATWGRPYKNNESAM